jgi:hypothetical protein
MARPEALEDKPSAPSRVWNWLPDDVRKQILAQRAAIKADHRT